VEGLLDSVNLRLRLELKGDKRDLIITDAADVAGAQPLRRPQELLDAWYETMADPTAWLTWDEEKRQAIVRDLLGLDFSDLDAEAKEVYEERLVEGRVLKQMQGQLKGMLDDPDAPTEPVPTSELLDGLRDVEAANAERQALAQRLTTAEDRQEALERRRDVLQKELKEVQNQLVDAANLVAEAEAHLAEHGDLFQTEPILQRIQEAESLNARYRAAQERRRLAGEVAVKEAQAVELGKRLAAITNERLDRIAKSKWPVRGMGWDLKRNLLTYQGIPLAQASSAEEARMSVAVSIALDRRQHPAGPDGKEPERLKVALLRQASMLDADNRGIILEMLEEAGYQALIEVAGHDAEASVVVEDGVATQVEPEGQKEG